MIQHAITFGVGILMRLRNEHQKEKAQEQKMLIAIATKNKEIINEAKDKVIASTFMQTMMMIMVMSALAVVAGFSLIAAWMDVPLVIETVEKSGFWIFSTDVKVFKEVSGLLLPEEFRVVIIAATEFIFGAVVGGIGRR